MQNLKYLQQQMEYSNAAAISIHKHMKEAL